MKKSESALSNRVRRPRGGDVSGKPAPKAPSATSIRKAPVRTGEPLALLQEHFPDSEAHPVNFDYFNPTAHEVLVAGSFNNWQPHATPMRRRRGGHWSAQLLLKPGEYEYRFVVDGQWLEDPMAARFVSNPFGSLNCVVEVESMTATSRPRLP